MFTTHIADAEAKGVSSVKPMMELALSYAAAAESWRISLSESLKIELKGEDAMSTLRSVNLVYNKLLRQRNLAKSFDDAMLESRLKEATRRLESSSLSVAQQLAFWCRVQEFGAEETERLLRVGEVEEAMFPTCPTPSQPCKQVAANEIPNVPIDSPTNYIILDDSLTCWLTSAHLPEPI